jgi:hypothetical protein
MKRVRASAVFLLAVFGAALVALAQADNAEFPGVEKAMTPDTFQAAGLNKLSPEERAKLDEFIRGYVTKSSEKAATAAVDAAVKDRKVKEPEVIQSNIVGLFHGYNGRSSFTLANGQVWAQAQQESRAYPPIDSPPVLITKGRVGYRMYIAGGGNIRVSRVR